MEFEKADRVYVGRDSGCRCGCAGNYHEAGTRGFKMAITKARRLIDDGATVQDDGFDVNVQYGNNRALTFYFDG